jgi:hypothetical protein
VDNLALTKRGSVRPGCCNGWEGCASRSGPICCPPWSPWWWKGE